MHPRVSGGCEQKFDGSHYRVTHIRRHMIDTLMPKRGQVLSASSFTNASSKPAMITMGQSSIVEVGLRNCGNEAVLIEKTGYFFEDTDESRRRQCETNHGEAGEATASKCEVTRLK